MSAPPKLRSLMRVRFDLSPPQEIGATAHGHLIIFPIVGGSFEGERLRGRILSGADWVTKRDDGVYELDLRVTLETDDGALVHMNFTGVRDDAHRYFRTTARFETAAARYAFLDKLLAVGVGEMGPDGPVHVLEEIL